MKNLAYILSILCLTSCSFFGSSDENKEEPIARVFDKYLYPSNLENIGRNLSVKDSVRNTENYIQNWITKQLLLKEALLDSSINQTEIENKLKELRTDLYLYEYEKLYSLENTNTDVSEKEILDYYETHPDNFVLKQNIFKGYFIKIDRQSENTGKASYYLSKGDSTSLKKLVEICKTEAETYYIDTTRWHNLDDIVRNTPLENSNQTLLLKNTGTTKKYTKDFIFFLKVNEYKLTDDLSPIHFHTDMIRSTIIQKRKREIIKQKEREIFEQAKTDKNFELLY